MYFAHVPRCAGSAVEDYLFARFGPLGFLDRSHMSLPSVERWSNSSPQHIAVKNFERLVPPKWIAHCFAVVRHPEDRFISVFRFQRDVEQSIDPTTIFEDWLAQLPKQHKRSPYTFDNHTLPAAELVPSAAAIFKLEDGLDAVVRWLDDLEATTRLPREILPKNSYTLRMQQASREPKIPVVVTPAARQIISELYEIDFRRFGYEPHHT